ncbi:MAG TPA: glycoside hydrolase family 57 protein [Candidatus Angelobacter sp.]|nr:glycoside hydrolase family 57 protein [Candidatus Angelobacter sp.]
MPAIRLLFLWHMHQPFYKDLVTGQYRLPWVRLHALKDYFGMVKLLDEFPGIHQTFNLVPSLITQMQDYVAGVAYEPFLDIAAKPASELTRAEKEFAIQYLFQANPDRMIGRYPRYRELWQAFGAHPEEAPQLALRIAARDLTDLQVLSQIAWMDEFFLDQPEIRELIGKERDYSLADQEFVIRKQREFLATVLPAYKAAADHGGIEISTSPYYHPILPLISDTNLGAVAHTGLVLPEKRFQHPEDAREQIARGIALHEQVFGRRPRGMWPSEGSVSNETLAIASGSGLKWIASDEGVLGRTLGTSFFRDGRGHLESDAAKRLYQVFLWEREGAGMHVLFRDHSLSDLIGFVYSGVPAQEAAEDFIRRVGESAEPVLESGRDAVVPIILDGENAWESYPQSGREFLRRLYDGIQKNSRLEALTFSEAIERESRPAKLGSIFPGSWINANFDVWIGSPEDNLAWDYLSAAHNFYTERSSAASAEQKNLAYEELLIAEGSDWNWWYGPEHHSANDRDFDELYRKHLANVYQALGASPPYALAQPITAVPGEPRFHPQSAYIHPVIDGKDIGYFDWVGAATHVAERRSSAMHGRAFLLEAGYAGIDEANLYCRLDFAEAIHEWASHDTHIVVTVEPEVGESVGSAFRLEADVSGGQLQAWRFSKEGDNKIIKTNGELGGPAVAGPGIKVCLDSIFECQMPLALLSASEGSLLGIRFALWRDRLPLDSLPHEGFLEVEVAAESELAAMPYAKP